MIKKLIIQFKSKFELKSFMVMFLVLAICFLFLLLIYECPTEYLLGIPCPWCGLSRAFFSLAKLDIINAFYYHPLFPVIIGIAIYEFLKWLELFNTSLKFNLILYGVIFIAFIVVFIARHIAGSPIVAIDLENSVLLKSFVG